MRITILDDYQHVIRSLRCFRMLDGLDVQVIHYTEKDIRKLAALLQDTEILVLTRERTVISSSLLSLLPRLRLISQTGKISNHLDIDACTQHTVAVAEGVGSPIAPAELTWALLLNTLRLLPQAIAAMKEGKWQVNIGRSVHGKTLGIWGYGKIGQMVARYASAFGAKVLVWGRDASLSKAMNDGYECAASKAVFFASSDIVTLHLRLVPATQGIVTLPDLLSMKEDAVLINTARAELIAPGALLTALKAGRPGYAGLDVYEDEPVSDPGYSLLRMPNVICTPHLGYVEQSGYELYFGKAFENVLHYINGEPANIVNPEVLL